MLFEGLFSFSVLGYVGITLLLTHITIASVTIFLHRHQAHHALTLHPIVSHFFRFWLWMTTGMVTKEWVAIHRKHHAKCETEEDPHSPRHKGIGTVLVKGVVLYRHEAQNQETLDKYGSKTPDDWLERNVYSRHPVLGLTLMGLIDLALFGVVGLAMFLVQIAWIPFWAAGVINGIGHFFGYRNFETSDASTNIVPWGIIIGGEELHNNHHAYGASAKLSNKWWEFDIGWMYIRILEILHLAKVTRRAPKLYRDTGNHVIDVDTVRAIVSNRFHVLKLYSRRVTRPVMQSAAAKADRFGRKLLRRARKPMTREDLVDGKARETVSQALLQSPALATVYQFKQRLQAIWQQTAANQASRVQQLQAWCHEAEQTGIQALAEFSRTLRGYSLQPA